MKPGPGTIVGRSGVGLGVTLLCLLGVAVGIGCSRVGGGAGAVDTPEAALGVVLAEETTRLLGGKGAVVILTEAGAAPGTEAAVERFAAALRGQSGVKVVATERLEQIDPLLRTLNPGGSAIPPDAFLRAVAAHPQADALVSFVGVPAVPPASAGGAQRRAKLIAVWNTAGSPELERALAQGAVTLAVVARDEAPASGGAASRRAREVFDRYYLLVVPDGERG